MSELYTRIEKLCEENNTNVTELCRELKMPRSPLSELKAGRSRTLSTDKLILIAQHFNVSMDWLTGNANNENRKTNERINEASDLPDDLILFNRKAKNLTPEQRKQLFDVARAMFKEDFSE